MKRELFFKICSVFLNFVMVFCLAPTKASADSSSDKGNGTYSNPVIYADVPDVCTIRVGSTYYMASTTMHMSPGVPIMKSTDLVNWEIVNYVYDRIGENDAANLTNGKNMYGKGSWAASLKYNKGTYYCSFMSYTTNKTYIYQTKDIENGTWTKSEINGCYHDMSLLFDDDGRVYMLYGGTQIKYVELTSDATGIKWGGTSGTLFDGSRLVGQSLFEGTQATKINGYYYVFNIAWPSGKPRTEYCSRSKSLTGPWEHKVICQTNFQGAGVAQGGIIDTPDGKWYALLFKDNGSVGRSPVLAPVTWQNGWPMVGSNNGTSVSATYPMPVTGGARKTIVKSDEFDGKSSGKTWSNGLGLVWQWNHNPDNMNWSITQRPGYLRLRTGMTTNALHTAKNTLTQRTYGPNSSARVCIDVTNMKNGDVAGLTCFAYNYGYVGVKMENGSKQIVMINAPKSSESQIEAVNINTNKVYLKIDCSFGYGDKANFFYSTDGSNWKKIGNQLNMSYDLTHFMGYRFGLFNFARQQTGGYVDFDYFRVNDELKGAGYDPSGESTNPSQAPVVSAQPSKNPIVTGSIEDGLYYIKNVNAQKYLQVADNNGAAGQNVEIGTGTGVAGQKWYVTNTSDEYVTLTSALGNFMIDIAMGSSDDGANVQIYHGYSGDAQKYLIQKTSTDGVYTIATKASGETKNLDVYGRGTADGTNVCQWSYTGNTNQQWIFEKVNATPEASVAPSVAPSVKPSVEPSVAPSVAPSTEPSVAPSKAPAGDSGISYKYSITSDWGSGFQAELVVTNNSTNTYNGWTLTCDYNSTITSLWGAELVSQTGTKVTIKNPSWDAALAPGQSITINFVANAGSDKNAPTNYVLS